MKKSRHEYDKIAKAQWILLFPAQVVYTVSHIN